MKLVLDRTSALDVLGHIHAVVERKGTIPILANMLLTATEGRLAVVGTDLDIEVRAEVEAAVTEPGAITAPAGRLYDILRSLPAGAEMGLELSAGRLTVRSGRSRFQLPTLPAGDFPIFSEGSGGHRGEVEAKALAWLLDHTAFSMSSDATRFTLCGAFLTLADSGGGSLLRVVATDGARLAMGDVPAPAALDGLPSMILPRKAVGELRRLLDGLTQEMVEVWSDGKRATFKINGLQLATKLIDGQYPQYTRVIPSGLPRTATFDVALLNAAIKRAAILVAGEKLRSVRLALEEGRVTVRSRDPQDGSEAEEAVEVEYSGDPVELGFNTPYLLEALGQMSGRTATLEFGGPRDAVKVIDPLQGGLTNVVMPLIA